MGPSWLSCIERYRKFRNRFVHSSVWLGLQTVSLLERCPLLELYIQAQQSYTTDLHTYTCTRRAPVEQSLQHFCYQVEVGLPKVLHGCNSWVAQGAHHLGEVWRSETSRHAANNGGKTDRREAQLSCLQMNVQLKPHRCPYHAEMHNMRPADTRERLPHSRLSHT